MDMLRLVLIIGQETFSSDMHDIRRRLESLERHMDMQTGVMKSWGMVLERMVKAVENLEKVALNE